MHTRREFMGLAAGLAGGLGSMGSLLAAVEQAAAIGPARGTSFLDAEHVVILMQENRSFDHTYGTLRGVRGFGDPRAVTLPGGNPVWVQADDNGKHHVPFRLDLFGSKATWMGDLPHGWADQVDARNGGLHDRWLQVKRSRRREYAELPLTLGYHTRADIPFYYALADSFTVCDQYFCSTLTGTTPNRLHLWAGTIRAKAVASAMANVRNDEVDLDHLADWPTFPERLEDHGISWKVYQNELTVDSGLSETEDAWLANFGDNPLEYFRQYRAHLAANHRRHVARRLQELPGEIAALRVQLELQPPPTAAAALRKRLAGLTAALRRMQANQAAWGNTSLEQLSARDRALHANAFCTNQHDPAYRQLQELTYRDGDKTHRFQAPKGDLFHQFRADVEQGKLPKVSWLVGPEMLSDHPSAAWYGAWYVAAALDILTRNPDVWQKTVFLLTYDENDGFFDHVPPFVAPRPGHPETGRTTKGIDAGLEYVERSQDRRRERSSPMGLGYRVPMVIASPWTRGGCVCSQVFDHTSVLQFLEHWLSRKTGKKIVEPNINAWRRTVCGDLTAAFQDTAKDGRQPAFPQRDEFLTAVHRAQFKEVPTGHRLLTPEEIAQICRDPRASPLLPRQEPGVRPSSPLPYQLEADGALNPERTHFTLRFAARTDRFGDRAAGSAFRVQALDSTARVQVRDYAVEAGDSLEDAWPLADFPQGRYHLRAYGPNGFFREFQGGPDDPPLDLHLEETLTPPANAATVVVVAVNRDKQRSFALEVRDNAYGHPVQTHRLTPGESTRLTVPTQRSSGWYDLSIRVGNDDRYAKRYAGRVETGTWSISDPAMGG